MNEGRVDWKKVVRNGLTLVFLLCIILIAMYLFITAVRSYEEEQLQELDVACQAIGFDYHVSRGWPVYCCTNSVCKEVLYDGKRAGLLEETEADPK